MIKQKISVIIPTKNRPGHLKRCLESIALSHAPYSELIVVDSSTKKHTRDKIRELVEQVRGKYFYESRSGVSFARNLGLRKASGDIVIFVDDDFIVKKGWIENLVRNYGSDHVACCTGRMVSYRTDKISGLFEISLSFDRGRRKRIFTKADIKISKLFKTIRLITRRWLGDEAPVPWSVGIGFYSFRKRSLDKVGFFDENLGRGTPTRGGEEVDMYYRLLKEGYKIIYEPQGSFIIITVKLSKKYVKLHMMLEPLKEHSLRNILNVTRM